jgi:hypothetical protein
MGQFNQASGDAAEFACAVERILADQRNPDTLCKSLSGLQFALMVETILKVRPDPRALMSLVLEENPAV